MRTTGLAGVLFLALAGCSSQANDEPVVDMPGTIALVNPGFEASPGADGAIEGWAMSQHAGPSSYKMEVDRTVHAAGAASFRIERTRQQVYGAIAQNVPIAAHAGHTIELSAQMKTENVGRGGWQLMLTFTGGVPKPRREAAPVAGTQGFGKVVIRTQVPAGAQEVEIAAILNDGGTAWLDDVRLRVVD